MSSMFRAGHNKPRPRLREPLRLEHKENLLRKRAPLLGIAVLALILAAGWALQADAHPGHETHATILNAPIAGVRNNYWYDYRSDVDEAENELRKDLRRAKNEQDRREAWAEYNQELRDARSDYRKEMTEQGYLPRGKVTVGDGD